MPELPTPLAAVIVPVHNKSASVARTIQSIQNQTVTNLECVIINDGSTDNSEEVILEAIKGDARFRYISQKNRGVAEARNRGVFRETSALLISCLDSDDAIAPTFLEVCAKALQEDSSLDIAYTGLWYVLSNGQEGLNDWPGQFDADAQITGFNQIPTCNLARRRVWERTGGQRSRFSPWGAGEEDAEMWLRAISLGCKPKKVTDEGLFVYSYLSGSVSGDLNHISTNWLSGKPWIKDGFHPFASLATPANGISHPVHQYDQPLISVIIPVGPYHIKNVSRALDSLIEQSFRDWEVIVVLDGAGQDEIFDYYLKAYPFALFLWTGKQLGAGGARNLGAEYAKAPFITFLDADDWLLPDGLSWLLKGHSDNPGEIIYGDYIGHAYIEDRNEIDRYRRHNRLVFYNEATTEAIIRYQAFEFDCERAQRQPEEGKEPYIWNIITSLIPKQYFDEIGGFDETMVSWEDWDLFLRLARRGHCFSRVPQPVIEYPFYTGERRRIANPGETGSAGRQLSSELLQYLRDKYKGEEPMPCGGCGGKRSRQSTVTTLSRTSLNEGSMSNLTANDTVTVELVDGNYGEHMVAFRGTNYGYRKHGDKFKMKKEHAEVDRRVRVVEGVSAVTAQQVGPAPQPAPPAPPPPPAPPSPPPSNRVERNQETEAEEESEEIVIEPQVEDFTRVWGINEERQNLLISRGVRSLDGLRNLGEDDISKMFDVPSLTAKRILADVQRKMEDDLV